MATSPTPARVTCSVPVVTRADALGARAPKLIYLARQRPRTSIDEFVRRWRRHGALGMSMDFWANTARYAQCTVRAELRPGGGVRASDWSGFGMVWDRPGPRRSFPSDLTARTAMLDDERETFADAVAACQLRAFERPRTADSPGAEPAVAAQLVRVLDFPALTGTAALSTAWEDHARGLAARHPEIVRHCLDVVSEPAPPGGPLDCVALDEVGFASWSALLAAIGTDDFTSVRDGSGMFLGSARAFVTDRVVLYDAAALDPLT